MRIYNPNIARFLSIDPLSTKYSFLTPYQFAGNKPIYAIDLDGLEESAYTRYLDKQFSTVKGSQQVIQSHKEIAKLVYKPVASAVFKGVFDENLPKNLIDHYVFGGGSTYNLSKSEMVQLHVVHTGIQGITPADNIKFNKLLNGAKPGAQINLPKGFSIQGAASTGGTLGRFQIELQGKIIIDSKDPNKWTFVGKMRFSDTWDFKTTPISSKDMQRTEWGDIQTKFGGKFLIGQGFKVTSEWVNITQKSTDLEISWFKGKPQNSVQNKVSNEIKNNPNSAKPIINEVKRANGG